jgi:colicin import membrane protein
MSEPRGDRVLPVVLSILIHAAIIGSLVWGWWHYRAPTPPPQTLAIEATVVHDAPQSAPAPPAPAPPTPTPPPPDPQVEEQRQQAEKEAAAKAEAERQAQAEAEAKSKAQAEARAQAEAKAQAEARADAEAKAKADAEEAAAAAAKAKAEADAKAKVQAAAAAAAAAAKVEADRKAQQLAQQQRAEQEREQREADLRAQLKAEEHLDQARTNGALAQYQAMIAARIERAWIRPPSAHAGINCQVRITQVPGGAVTAVQVGTCNGDDALRQSISDAAYRASPLPAPPDPALFDRDVVVTFAPHE